MKLLALCLSFLALPAFANLNREPMVEAAFRAMPTLISYFRYLPSTQAMSQSDLDLIESIEKLAKSDSVALHFSDNRADFFLNDNESERLMRATAKIDTTSGMVLDAGEIYVNRALLNDPDRTIDFALILKLLFHEYGHKTPQESWGIRDRLTQQFANELDPFISIHNLNESLQLTVLSLPANRIDHVLDKTTSINIPLQTNVLIVKRGSEYFDATPHLMKKMAPATAILRSLWSEANFAFLSIAGQLMGMIDQIKPALGEIAQKLNHAFGGNLDTSDFDKFIRPFEEHPSEIRTLDIHNVEPAKLNDSTFVSLRSTYTVSRSMKNGFNVDINLGNGKLPDSFPMPVDIYFEIPHDPAVSLETIRYDIRIRPEVDFTKSAVIVSVRRFEGSVQFLKLKGDSLQPIKSLLLSCRFADGFIQLPIHTFHQDGTKWTAEVEIPSEFLSVDKTIVADSILVNGETTVYLDRLLPLKELNTSSVSADKPITLVPGSVGFWGSKNSSDFFKSNFKFGEFSMMLDNVNSDQFSFNPSRFTVEMQVEGDVDLREIRIYLSRQELLLRPEEKSIVQFVPYNGVEYPITNGGGLVESKEFHDIVTIPQSEIFVARLPGGIRRVRATVKVPYKLPWGLPSDKSLAYGPSLAFPTMVEAVTDDLQTLQHYFSEELKERNCADFFDLKAAANGKSQNSQK